MAVRRAGRAETEEQTSGDDGRRSNPRPFLQQLLLQVGIAEEQHHSRPSLFLLWAQGVLRLLRLLLQFRACRLFASPGPHTCTNQKHQDALGQVKQRSQQQRRPKQPSQR